METYRADTAPPRTHGGRPSLAVANPELAAEWDHEVNGALTPWHVTAGSDKNVGWKCSAHGHQWAAGVSDRTKGRGCPICAGKTTSVGYNDLGSVNPALAAEWDEVANGTLTPEHVTAGSNKSVRWKCTAHGHLWTATVNSRTSGNGCPICAGRVVLAGYNDLRSKNPILAAEWDQEANGKLTPEQVTVGSAKRVGWKCTAHGHQWTVMVQSRTSGSDCPICAGQIVLAGYNDLRSKNPTLAAEWDQEANGKLTPKQVTVSSDKKVGWKCTAHGHQWVTKVNSRTSGCDCPICAGRIVLAGYNDLRSKNPTLAAEWDQEANGKLTPKQVTVSSNKRVGWKCAAHGHLWTATVTSRTKGNGCAACSQSQTSKIEQAFFNELQKFLDDARNGAKLPTAWRKRKTSLVDITGTHHGRKIVVEYDGARWHGSAFDRPGSATKEASDMEKTEALLADGYLVVRIRENELPHLPIVNVNLHQLSFDIPGSKTDEQRAELVKPTVEKIMAWLDVSSRSS